LKEIVIVDYGLGNVGSLVNMFEYLNVDTCISSDANVILDAEKLILPGVGAFDHAMEKLEGKQLIEVLSHKVVKDSCPVLGVCLGMQIMCNSSDEGVKAGLGWVDGKVTKISSKPGLVVPHMGWNHVKTTKMNPLIQEFDGEPRFYFVHSFQVELVDKNDEILSCHYGADFTCGFQSGNIFGVQFHPEKSHRFGKDLLKNFADLVC
jgi:glutamine amidotransferase